MMVGASTVVKSGSKMQRKQNLEDDQWVHDTACQSKLGTITWPCVVTRHHNVTGAQLCHMYP